MRILYITRKFPPSIGGMQTQSYEFYNALRTREEVCLVCWRKSQKFLPIFLIIAMSRSLYYNLRYNIDIIQVGDLALSPLGLVLKMIFHKPVLAMSHGKDTYFSNALYQYFVPRLAKRLNGIICVSSFLRRELLSKGLQSSKLFVMPNGINPSDYVEVYDSQRIKRKIGFRYGISLDNIRIILSVSRLVKKKGILNFVKNILPGIMKDIPNAALLLVGEDAVKEAKEEKALIIRAAKESNLSNKIFFLGSIRERDLLNQIYSISDVFIMPNIQTTGDIEGFGIVALEASMNKIPVVAFDVGGISEAIRAGRNGILVEEGNNEEFARAVKELLVDEGKRSDLGKKARSFVAEDYNWDRIINRYIAIWGEMKKMT